MMMLHSVWFPGHCLLICVDEWCEFAKENTRHLFNFELYKCTMIPYHVHIDVLFSVTGVTVFLCAMAIAVLGSRCHAPTVMLANFIATPIELR